MEVLQGGVKDAGLNIKLGETDLNNIEQGVKGTPTINVTFELDEDGLLSMHAIDKKTLSKVNLEMSNTLDIPESTIDRMQKLAKNLFND